MLYVRTTVHARLHVCMLLLCTLTAALQLKLLLQGDIWVSIASNCNSTSVSVSNNKLLTPLQL